jgi:hypothetical protein
VDDFNKKICQQHHTPPQKKKKKKKKKKNHEDKISQISFDISGYLLKRTMYRNLAIL